jgi:hypothetical protein
MAQLDDERTPPRVHPRRVKVVRCTCGHLVCGDTAEQLLHALEAHIDAAHQHMPDAASRAQLGARQVQETITDAARGRQLRSADGQLLKEEP